MPLVEIERHELSPAIDGLPDTACLVERRTCLRRPEELEGARFGQLELQAKRRGVHRRLELPSEAGVRSVDAHVEAPSFFHGGEVTLAAFRRAGSTREERNDIARWVRCVPREDLACSRAVSRGSIDARG